MIKTIQKGNHQRNHPLLKQRNPIHRREKGKEAVTIHNNISYLLCLRIVVFTLEAQRFTPQPLEGRIIPSAALLNTSGLMNSAHY